MKNFLDNSNQHIKNQTISISGSKSESNRMLILKELFSNIELKNLSTSKDTEVLQQALASNNTEINIGHTGTAMRFLTAFFATKKGKEIILTGSLRMQKRPVKILVNALRDLGAEITYLKKEGFPPLKIKGKILNKDTVSILGNVSSQYITALLLLAPSLKNGLEITLKGKITSKPYIEMTLNLLQKIGVQVDKNNNILKIYPKKNTQNTTISIESDWSSASYFYSFIALSGGDSVSLNKFFKESLQGDSKLVDIYKHFGVTTIFKKDTIVLKKESDFNPKKHLQFDLNDTPDLAQTVAVTCVGLGVSCTITGLHTLKIKETDRLEALKNELEKLGAQISITEDSIAIKPQKLKENITVKTYDDHRMAMAFAPLSLKVPIYIENPSVVAKSYPNFWKDVELLFSKKN